MASSSQHSDSHTEHHQSQSRMGYFFSTLPTAGSVLIAAVGCLMVISLLMVASASTPFAIAKGMDDLHFFYRQLMFMLLGITCAYGLSRMSAKRLLDPMLHVVSIAFTLGLLFLTLVFAAEVNGSKRWLEIGPWNFQPAELTKLVIIMFTGSFVVRRSGEVRHSVDGFIKMTILLIVFTGLLLLQPDFGSVVIISGCVLAMFYVAGSPLIQFITLATSFAIMGAIATIFEEYRMERVLSFLDPFDDVQDTDYQLSRSLFAFSRGEVTGVGYGQSIQKMSHLPEAHTDFLLAITGEEMGMAGVLTVILLQALVILSAMKISYNALKRKHLAISYTAFGMAIMFFGQSFINAGMNMGILPTKGLTMPFFSYGGSAMLICLLMVGILVRFDKDSAKYAHDWRYYEQ